MPHKLRRWLTFAVIGGSGTLLYALLAYLFMTRFALPNALGSALAYGVCAMLSYIGNRTLTFQSRAPVASEMPRFALTSALGYALATGIQLALEWIGDSDPKLAIVAVCITVPIVNYVLLSRFVYKSTILH